MRSEVHVKEAMAANVVQKSKKATLKSIIIVLATAVSTLFLCYSVDHEDILPEVAHLINGIAYSPYQRWDAPSDPTPKQAEIIQDIQQIATIAKMVRTYSAQDDVVDLAIETANSSLHVIPGAWTGVNPQHDSQELDALIRLGHTHKNIKRLLVGNEVLLRQSLSVDTVQQYIEKVRAGTKKLVSVAEPWHVWLSNPTLAHSVDFLAVHILPYWEGIPVDQAVPYVDQRLKQVQKAYPGKPILLAEVGWPSAGKIRGAAKPSKGNQAYFVRTFIAHAKKHNIDYILLEAYDQPWKRQIEGQVGSHWGVFNASREPKWPLAAPLRPNSQWLPWAFIVVLVGGIFQFIYLYQWPHLRIWQAVILGLCFQAWTIGLLWPYISLSNQYLSYLGLIVWVVLSMAQFLLFALLAVDLVELANVLWHKPLRCLQNMGLPSTYEEPFVSIHVACSDEPPNIVSRTLAALSQLDYQNYEVIVVSNNCSNPSRWKPIRDHCSQLGPKFHFLHRDYCPGYKAGALNLALNATDLSAEIIAVVDSDYVVDSEWLHTLTPVFENPDIGIVQSPQDHLVPKQNEFQRKCFWEYAGFFQVGMIQRNEANAIIQHGTMVLIRETALRQVNGWSEWCITEDAELGLRLLSAGWDSLYVPRSFGRGLLPSDFSAYKTQRFRWAYGAMTILGRFGPALLGFRKNRLNIAQKYHFIAGWLPWAADAGGLLFTLAALVWTVAMLALPDRLSPPLALFLVPVLVAFVARQLRDYVLYAIRVKCSLKDSVRATIAGQALGYTVARAVFASVFLRNVAFQKTRKHLSFISPNKALRNATTEIAILITITALTLLYGLRSDLRDSSNMLWLAILTILAVPYASAFMMACGDARARLRSPSSPVSIEEIQIHAHTEGKDKNTANEGHTTKATV